MNLLMVMDSEDGAMLCVLKDSPANTEAVMKFDEAFRNGEANEGIYEWLAERGIEPLNVSKLWL